MDKQFLRKEHATKYAMIEREVLSKVNYQLIMGFYYSFQDEKYLYMVLELCRRGNLHDCIKMHFDECNKPFNKEIIQFYSAEIILALQYLHIESDVVHRDLKPENVLIASDGHIRLSDFGTALVNQKLNSYRKINYTFCGTAQYVSPELLKDQPIGPAVDLWALGCIIYQLYYGKSPFYAENEYLIFDKVLQYNSDSPNIFPKDNLPPNDLINLILSLMCNDPHQRLGAGFEGSLNDYNALIHHKYFDDYDFSNTITNTPPLIPPETITENFPKDPIDNIDDFSLEDQAEPVKLHLLDLTSSSSSGSNSQPSTPASYSATPPLNHSLSESGQESSCWSVFLEKNEKIIKTSAIWKRKTFRTVKRQLILTNIPRIIVVDPRKMKITKIIYWESPLTVILRSQRAFDVKTVLL